MTYSGPQRSIGILLAPIGHPLVIPCQQVDSQIDILRRRSMSTVLCIRLSYRLLLRARIHNSANRRLPATAPKLFVQSICPVVGPVPSINRHTRNDPCPLHDTDVSIEIVVRLLPASGLAPSRCETCDKGLQDRANRVSSRVQ